MTEPEPLNPVAPPLATQRAADVLAPAPGEGVQVTRTYPVRQPADDWNDFQVGVWANVLRRCRRRLVAVTRERVHIGEALLGLATLTGGGSLSAVIASVKLDSPLGIAFYVISPMVAVGCGVAYGMLRATGIRTARHLAEDVLLELPDPDNTVETRPR
jgi:hypothetical protein